MNGKSENPPLWAILTGAILGIAASGYFLFYLPMSHNYASCGKITLCEEQK